MLLTPNCCDEDVIVDGLTATRMCARVRGMVD